MSIHKLIPQLFEFTDPEESNVRASVLPLRSTTEPVDDDEECDDENDPPRLSGHAQAIRVLFQFGSR